MPGVAGKSGRKAKTVLTRQTNQIIEDTAPHAAQYLMKVVKGEVKRPSLARIEVCKFVINHAIGSPRQKIEHSGEIQTSLSDLARSAEEALRDAGFIITRESVGEDAADKNPDNTEPA